MGRPPSVTPSQVEQIATMAARDDTADHIAHSLGIPKRTVERHLAKVKKGQPASAPVVAEPPAPPPPTYPLTEPGEEDLEGAPEDDPLFGTYDGVLRDVERLGRLARANSNLGLLARCEALKISALEAKRKAAPPEVPDPNEAIDMIAAAKRARDTLHRLVATSPEDG